MHLWTRWVNEQTTEVLLLKINQGNTNHVFTVDSCHSLPRSIVYIPDRYSTEFDIANTYDAELLESLPPIATQITLQLLESDFEGIDIASATSEYLSKCNVLKRHAILQVPFPDLGDLVLDILVVDTAPEEIVLLRGEVPLEIVNSEPLPEVAPTLTTPTTTPTIIPTQETSDFDSFDDILPIRQTCGFQPFSGKGYRLGS